MYTAEQICDMDFEQIEKLRVPHHLELPAELEPAKMLACEGMRRTGTKIYASKMSGIGRSALNDLLKSDPEFRRAMWAARQELYDQLETAMIRRGMLPRGDLAGIFITKHNRRRYHEVQRVELTGKDGAPVAYVDAKEELLRRIAAAQSRGAIDVEAVAAGSGGSRGPALVGGSQSEQVKASVRKSGDSSKLRSSRR